MIFYEYIDDVEFIYVYNTRSDEIVVISMLNFDFNERVKHCKMIRFLSLKIENGMNRFWKEESRKMHFVLKFTSKSANIN